MNDKELKKTFPYGLQVIPRQEDAPAFEAVVGAVGEGEEEGYFFVWMNRFADAAFQVDLVAKDDGFVAKNGSGAEFFLRPLPKEREYSI
jgi:hypothetical protein